MSPTTVEPDKPHYRKPTQYNRQASPLDQLRVPARRAKTSQPLKVSDIVGPLVIDPIAPSDDAAKMTKTKKSIWQQMVQGARLAAKVIVPTWLLLWLGGYVANKAIITLGLKAAPPISRSIDSNALQRAQINSTPELNSSIIRAQAIKNALRNGNITGETAQKALASNNLSNQSIWQKLSATRSLLRDYSPQLSDWFEQKYTRGEVSFVSDEFEFGGERYTDYRGWSHTLTIYPGFFDLNDGQKVSIIRHERSHADETWPEYISNSLQPSVFVGATFRAGSLLAGNISSLLSSHLTSILPGTAALLDQSAQNLSNVGDPESLASKLSYTGNRSERQAMQTELECATELGVEMAADPATIDSISSQSHNPTAWQEIVGLAGVSVFGLASLLRRRERSARNPAMKRVATPLAQNLSPRLRAS